MFYYLMMKRALRSQKRRGMGRLGVGVVEGVPAGQLERGSTVGRNTVACAASLQSAGLFGQHAPVICGIEG